jgi:hypothetical protein
MINKQQVLRAVEALPDTASWPEISDALFELLIREGLTAQAASLYRSQLTEAELKEYEQPRCEVSLGDAIAELELLHDGGAGR